MSRYRVQIDKPLPDKAQIAKFKNFDELHARYQTHTRFEMWRNLYRNPRTFAALVAVMAVTFLVVRPGGTESGPVDMPQLHLQGQSTAIQTQEMVGAEGSTWVLGPQEEITIAPYAFIDSQNQPVAGSIRLEWVAIQDPAEIFLQGPVGDLPLNRLMQLRAFQNGHLLNLSPTADIHWTLPASQIGNSLSAWDDSAKAWTQGSIQISTAPVAVATAPQPSSELLALRSAWERDGHTKALPTMPQRPERPFGVKLKRPEAHPEFRDYSQTYWTYIPGGNSVNPWTAGLVGADRSPQEVRIQKLSPDQYRLQFVRMDGDGDIEVIPVLARPVFEARTQATAQSLYETQLSDWQKAKNAYERAVNEQAQLKTDWEKAEADFAAEETAWDNHPDSVAPPRSQVKLNAAQLAYSKLSTDSLVIRFSASNDTLPHHLWAVSHQSGQLIPLHHLEDNTYHSTIPAAELSTIWSVIDSQTLWTARPSDISQEEGESIVELTARLHHPQSYSEALGILRSYLAITP